MIINGVQISIHKLEEFKNILPESVLRSRYESGLSGTEISNLHGLSERDISRLRRIYNISTDTKYHYRRNPLRLTSLTEYQYEFLYGSLLGDSCIAMQKSGSGYWRCRHGIKQEKYLLKKAGIMFPFVSRIKKGFRSFKKGGKPLPYIDAIGYALPQFTELRYQYYPDGKKTITRSLFEKLSPRSFSFWFFDDGSTNGYGFDITTYDAFFKRPEAKDLFKEILNLDVSIHWKGKEGKIHILKSSQDIAWEYIKPEMMDIFSYKIPKKYRM